MKWTALRGRPACLRRTALMLCALMVSGCDGVFSGGSGASGGSGLFGTGLVVTSEEEDLNVLITQGLPLSGEGLPPSVDLSPWLPPALNQGKQSSCVGFALGYALTTFHEARQRGWISATESRQFSPSFVYDRIHSGDCFAGASLRDGVDLLINEGSLTLDRAPYDPLACTAQAGDVDLAGARPFRIRTAIPIAAGDKDTVRNHLSNGRPVVIGLKAFDQWANLSNEDFVYDPKLTDKFDPHAVLAVGYYDNEAVIKVFNSYGTDWGDDGYALIPYHVWPNVVLAGYVTEDEVDNPALHFNAPVPYDLSHPWTVASADLDGDGAPDLVAGTSEEDAVAVLLNHGDGTFKPPHYYGVGEPLSLALGDLDGDDDVDIVAGVRYGDYVSILLNDGDGLFVEQARYNLHRPGSVLLGDLDGDEDLDLVVATIFGDFVTVLLNHGDGTFDVPPSEWIDCEEASTCQLIGQGDGQEGPPPPDEDEPEVPGLAIYEAGWSPTSVALGDLNADGFPDLAVASSGTCEVGDPGTDTVSILLNNGDGTYAPRIDYSAGDPSGTGLIFGQNQESVSLQDIDGDGAMDVVLAVWRTRRLTIFMNRGDGTLLPRTELDLEFEASAVTPGDLDGDGSVDLAVVGLDRSVWVLLNDGDGRLAEPLRFGTRGVKPAASALADFDGDGSLDIAVANGAIVQGGALPGLVVLLNR